MKMISLLLLISISTVRAATAQTVAAPGNATAAALATVSATATPTPAPAPPPNPIKVAYYGEYNGPRLSNLNLTQSQGPLDATPSYTGLSHSLKLGYALSDTIIVGLQTRTGSSFDPAVGFFFKDERIYMAWKHMISTSDIDMTGVIHLELPTSGASRTAGKILGFNILNNWIFNTSLRNWSFSALTLLFTKYFNAPGASTTDVYVALDPTISVDITPSWAIALNANFDASHSYTDSFFNYGQDSPDYIEIGPQWTVNANLQIYPALQFYTYDLSVPTLYMNVSASL